MNYVPLTDAEVRSMLSRIGVDQVADLFADVPEEHRFPELALGPGVSQLELERLLQEHSDANVPVTSLACFLGAGAYHHYIPPVVDALASRGEFVTAYTPYQPEISQGTLTAIFEFQSMIATLTGMEVANASLYDGGTALAEAVLMAGRIKRRDGLVLAGSLHPRYRAVARTYCQALGLPITEVPPGRDGRLDIEAARAAVTDQTACLAVGYPNFYGVVEDLASIGELAHAQGALFIVSVNPIALGLLPAPGELGADIVVGEGQPLGIPLQFGGPYLGLLATEKSHMRQMPGRVVGETTDEKGRRGYVMTLRAREQDIRRERATSNICTNQALSGLVATVYLAALGEQGLREVARQCYHKAHYAWECLTAIDGIEPLFEAEFFHEFALRLPHSIPELNSGLLAEGILGPYDLSRADESLAGAGLFCVTETVRRDDIDRLATLLGQDS